MNSKLLSLVVLTVIISMTSTSAFADHSKADIQIAPGSNVPGCETNDECFIPHEISLDPGGEVTWTNDGTSPTTVTSGTANGGPDGLFDSGLIQPGESFSFKFEDAGEYYYFSMIHPWMQGSITVGGHGDEHDDDHGGHSDDHGDDHGDHMDDEGHLITEASATGMLSDGTEVKIWTSEPMMGERMEVHIEFVDAEHVNHDITVTQNGETVLDDMSAHHHGGSGMHETAPLSSDDPVDITVTFTGYGIDEKTGPIGEVVTFTNVVPEFGTIAAMILAVAIVSIIAVTVRSKLSLTPKI